MKALVTGCAGFIGSHTVERLIQYGMSVIGFDNLSRSGTQLTLDYLKEKYEGSFIFRHGDVRNVEGVAALFKDFGPFDLIVHEAGQVAVTSSIVNPRLDFETNAWGTLNLLDTYRICSPSATFIFASTNKVYGCMENLGVVLSESRYIYSACREGVSEAQPLDFHSPYGCSKGAADQYVRDFGRIYGLRTFVFRQSCIYGTRQYGMEDQGWVAWFVIAALLDKPITIYGDGFQSRDLLWIEDLVDLYIRVFELKSATRHRVFNVGGGCKNVLSLRELLSMLESMNILKQTPQYAEAREGDQKTFVADISLVRQVTGWYPIVAPNVGVDKLAQWVRDHIGDLRKLCNRK